MDYVYTCRSGPNEELRYSIRSVVKHAPNSRIWLIGGKPDWYVGNYTHIPNTGYKFDNIVNCIKKIPMIDGITEDFVLMDDDIYIVKPIDSMPAYYNGLLSEKIKYKIELGGGVYTRLLIRTNKELQKQGIKEPLNYDIHVPMPMNKTMLFKVMDKGYFPKSTYGNLANVGGQEISDVKVYTKQKERSYDYLNGDLPFISTLDESFQRVYEDVLKDMFPEPSPYEATA